jgi:Putative zinc-finger
VADKKQFGSPQQFGHKPSGNQPGDPTHCAQCEQMLADALDGTLSAADQALFDVHMAHCGPCSQMLADARRGAAWLELLRDPRPEPPAELLERILAQTSGAHTAIQPVPIPGAILTPAPIYGGASPGFATLGKVIPFRRRFAAAVRTSPFGQIVLQPRLAMTAAMAFFSIALTLNLTGVRLQDLRASDLRPSSLQRDFYSADARVVQYYEGLRVVYELESRVHDLQSTTDTDTDAPAQPAPQPAPDQPPAAQPSPAGQKPAPQPARKRPAPNPGTSRREDLNQSRRLVAAGRDSYNFRHTIHARVERTLA